MTHLNRWLIKYDKYVPDLTISLYVSVTFPQSVFYPWSFAAVLTSHVWFIIQYELHKFSLKE